MSAWNAPYRVHGGRCWLVGNGPSLHRLTPPQIAALNKEHLFMGSRFFEWADAPLRPSFYIVSERTQATQWLDGRCDRPEASIAKFWVSWQPAPKGWCSVPRPPSEAHSVTTFGLFGGLEGECHDGIDTPHLHHGKVTPMAALQVAHMMGFTEFYAIGCEATQEGEVYDARRVRGMHAPGIEREVWAKAASLVTDCTPGGLLALERGGPLRSRDLDEVLHLA